MLTTNKDSGLILVVDDDALLRTNLSDLITQTGYQVIEASNGKDAIAFCMRLHPDILLLDSLMPVMDGFTCCAKLQTISDVKNIPVLMMITPQEETSIEQVFAVGATEFITKPIQPTVLLQKLRRLLEVNRTMKELREQAEEANQREEQLRMALDASRMGIWNWDIQTNQITKSDNLAALFGWDKDSNKTYEDFLNAIHPEDRDFIKRSHQKFISNRGKYKIEFRVVLPDGNIRWLLNKGFIWCDSSRMLIRMIGTIIDITDRKQIQAELQRQNLRSQLFANMTLKIRQSLQIDKILQTSVTEVQKLLQTDRVLILQVHNNDSFLAVKESVVPSLPVLLGQTISNSDLNEYYIQQYNQGEISTIANIETTNIQPFSLQFLQQLAVKANLVVPIFLKNQLWGLLIAHQCSYPRQWTNW